MKLIYKPFGIVAGIVGGLLARRVFDAVWSRVDDAPPPRATTEQASLPRIVGAAALQGATFADTRRRRPRGRENVPVPVRRLAGQARAGQGVARPRRTPPGPAHHILVGIGDGRPLPPGETGGGRCVRSARGESTCRAARAPDRPHAHRPPAPHRRGAVRAARARLPVARAARRQRAGADRPARGRSPVEGGRLRRTCSSYVNPELGDVPLSYYPWDVLARQLIRAGTFPPGTPTPSAAPRCSPTRRSHGCPPSACRCGSCPSTTASASPPRSSCGAPASAPTCSCASCGSASGRGCSPARLRALRVQRRVAHLRRLRLGRGAAAVDALAGRACAAADERQRRAGARRGRRRPPTAAIPARRCTCWRASSCTRSCAPRRSASADAPSGCAGSRSSAAGSRSAAC